MFRSTFLAVCLAVAALVAAVVPSSAANRVALVIGNDDYEALPTLSRAVNDSVAIRDTLEGLGFRVFHGNNLSRRGTNRLISDFETAIGPGDEVFFFFSGHGVALGEENYLIPSDMPKPRAGEMGLVRDEAHAVTSLVRRVQDRGAGASFFVLDACRDNPFAATGVRSIGNTRGLTRVSAPTGVFLLYAAGYGQTALDRLGDDDPDPNSVFTRKLVPLLKTPGLSHVDIAKHLQRDVSELASTIRHQQHPAYYDQIIGEIVLLPGERGDDGDSGGGGTSPVVVPPPVDPALAAYNTVKDTTSVAMLQAFVDSFPDSVYATFARVRIDELTEPEPEPEKEFLALYAGYDLYGGDISRRTGLDVTSCAQACANNLGCNYFTFVADGKQCLLKGSYEYAVKFTGAISGRYFTATSSDQAPRLASQWEFHRQQDFPGNDMTEMRATFDGCFRACDANSACVAFSWAPKIARNNNCWLKHSAGEAVSNRIAINGNVHIGKRVARQAAPTGVVTSE